MSNLIGATFSLLAFAGSGFGRGALMAAGLTGSSFATAAFGITGFPVTGFAVTGFAVTGFAVTGFAVTDFAMGLRAGLLGFTVTFDVAGDGLDFAGGRTTFLGAAA